MTFYALFPLLVRFITSRRIALACLLASFAFATILYPHARLWPGEDRELAKNYAFLWFPTQSPVFMIGIVLFFATKTKLWEMISSFPPLSPWPIRAMGKISYSAYLCHFAILMALWPHVHIEGGTGTFIIAFLCVTAATAALSAMTYAFIETPMIRFGAHVIARLRLDEGHSRHSSGGNVAGVAGP
jgi:peptidoglycan/LPS O-acetylase OafA/YrhL